IRMEVDTKAGEAKVFRQRSDIYPAVAEIEHRRIVDDFTRLPVHHFVYAHGLLEQRTGVKKLHAKVHAIPGPLRTVGAKTDRLILVPIEVGQNFWQWLFKWLVRRTGERASMTLEPCKVEGL